MKRVIANKKSQYVTRADIATPHKPLRSGAQIKAQHEEFEPDEYRIDANWYAIREPKRCDGNKK